METTPAGYRITTPSPAPIFEPFRRIEPRDELDYDIGAPAPDANSGNTGNIHHFALIKKLADELIRRGWKDIRVEQQQVSGGVVKGLNKPDIQAIDKRGRRVVVEVDTSPAQSAKHQVQVRKADPNVRAIFLLINPKSGAVENRTIYNPKQKQPLDRRGPLPKRNGRLVLGEVAAEITALEMEILAAS